MPVRNTTKRMHAHNIAFVFACMSCSTIVSAFANSLTVQYVNAATKLMREHRANEALNVIDQAIMSDPNDAALYTTKASIIINSLETEQHKTSAAVSAINMAERLGDKSSLFYYVKAQVLWSLGQDDAAIRAIDIALKDPTEKAIRRSALVTKAKILADTKRFDQASMLLDKQAESGQLGQGDLIAHAQWCLFAKRYDIAIRDCKNLISQNKGPKSSFINKLAKPILAEAYAQSHQTKLAEAEYLDIIQTWPDDRKLISGALMYFNRTGNRSAASRAKQLINEIDADIQPF